MTLLTMIMKMSEGLGKTCAIFFLTILFSLPLGMLITLLRMSKNKVISSVTRFVIAVLRGTPLMLQLLAVTYGPYYLFGTAVAKNKLIPVVIAFAIKLFGRTHMDFSDCLLAARTAIYNDDVVSFGKPIIQGMIDYRRKRQTAAEARSRSIDSTIDKLRHRPRS